MTTTLIHSPRRLSDSELIDRVRHLAGHERRATACLIAHLAELDERRLYVAEGCASLFVYCVEVLHLAEGAAYNRIEAARAVRRFPVILEMLHAGSIHVTGVRMLAQYLTAGNHRSLLEEATHKSKKQIEEIVARIRPREPVATSVRKLPARGVADAGEMTLGLGCADAAPDQQRGHSSSVDAQAGSTAPADNVSTGAPTGTALSVTPAHREAKVSALAPDRYSVKFTADSETHKLLCQAQELLKHQILDGDAAKVIALALKVLVEKVSRERLGQAKRPRSRRVPSPVKNNSRHIPAEVKRDVWRRDRGRCAFVAAGGRRCTERGRLEFHHVKPFALGGRATTENIELRCRVHNQRESDQIFGVSQRPLRSNSFWKELDNVMRASRATVVERGHDALRRSAFREHCAPGGTP